LPDNSQSVPKVTETAAVNPAEASCPRRRSSRLMNKRG
jgi:hypothetical protein